LFKLKNKNLRKLVQSKRRYSVNCQAKYRKNLKFFIKPIYICLYVILTTKTSLMIIAMLNRTPTGLTRTNLVIKSNKFKEINLKV